jgi:hypothetical protein
MTILRTLGVAAFALAASVGVAAATTINFSYGAKDGRAYVESLFRFEYVENGSVTRPNNCEAQDGANSDCLLLPDKKTVRMTFNGGQTFSLLSFTFDGKGDEPDEARNARNARKVGEVAEADALWVSKTLGGTDQKFSEAQNASKVTFSGPLTLFSNVTELFFRTAGNGSARVDDLMVETAAVPLPAAGWLMLLGLGGLAAARRRKV